MTYWAISATELGQQSLSHKHTLACTTVSCLQLQSADITHLALLGYSNPCTFPRCAGSLTVSPSFSLCVRHLLSQWLSIFLML